MCRSVLSPSYRTFGILGSMGQLMVDQLIVRTTGRAALGISLMKPEPHNGSVVFLACGKSWLTRFVVYH